MTARRWLPYTMWGCAVLYYLFQYVLRVSPSVMRDELMVAFQVNAHGFGTLSSLAMYCYALMQVPAGVLTDVFGAKRVILCAILSCIAGIFVFATAAGLWQAAIGRILIGVGSSAAFLAVNKIGADWFPPQRRAFIFGMTMTAGTIGALNGGAPLAFFVYAWGWREVLLALAGIGGIIFIINALFLRASPEPLSQKIALRESFQTILANIRLVVSNPQVVLNAISALGIYMAISVVADLWGVSYLESVGLEKTLAAQASSLIYVGLCFGALLISWWSDRIGKRKHLILFFTFAIVAALSAFLFMPFLPLPFLCSLLFLVGFFTGAEMLCFALATELAPREVSGTVTGFVNGVVALGGAFIQQQVGSILDYVWCGAYTADGLRCYTTSEYQTSMAIVVGVVLLTGMSACWLKERKLQPQES